MAQLWPELSDSDSDRSVRVSAVRALHLSAKLLAAFGPANCAARIVQTRLVWRLLSATASLRSPVAHHSQQEIEETGYRERSAREIRPS